MASRVRKEVKMAWYYPKHVCGHDGDRIQLLGPHSGREYRLNAIQREDCPTCRTDAAQVKAAENGLQPLVRGTKKQLAWASQIRNGFLSDWPATLAGVTWTNDTPDTEELSAAETVRQTLSSNTDCRFWIDNRAMVVGSLIRSEIKKQRIAKAIIAGNLQPS